MQGMKKLLLVYFLLATASGAQQRGYGDKWDSVPSLRERQLLVLTNACRMAPVQYRNAYIGSGYQILLPANYPAVDPLYWNLALNRASRAHAVDMANNCGIQHPSCDGTPWLTRITSYYTKPYFTMGENIATGTSAAPATIKLWVLDSVDSIPPDKDPGNLDGHRANIMSGNYRELGCGYAYGSQMWYHFWVQDFSGGTPDYSNRIVGGCHFLIVTDTITFFANFWNSLGGPDSIAVVIEGQPHAMTLAMGTAARGTYSFVQARAAACRQYYFTASRGGTTWRYPEYGVLVTAGEGSCTLDYTPPESLTVVRSVPKAAPALRPLFSLRGSRVLAVSGVPDGLRPCAVTLADLHGRTLRCWRITPSRRRSAGIVLALPEHLSRGVYVGSVVFENGRRRSERLVIER
jgi:hypothetical protein